MIHVMSAVLDSVFQSHSHSGRKLNLANLQIYDLPQWLMEDLSKIDNLVSLNLSSNMIDVLPDQISLLSNLELLDVQYNELTAFPFCLTQLASLKKLKWRGNPLTCLPRSLRKKSGGSSSTKSLLAFLQRMKDKDSQFNRLKLMVVGKENVGKTSLLRSLRKKAFSSISMSSSSPFSSSSGSVSSQTLSSVISGGVPIPAGGVGSGLVSVSMPGGLGGSQEKGGSQDKSGSAGSSPNLSTNGIAVDQWDVEDKSDRFFFHTLDFGGQEVFYPTHQVYFFFSLFSFFSSSY